MYIVDPRLPGWLDFVELFHMRVGDSVLNLTFRREGAKTVFDVSNLKEPLDVVATDRWPY